MALPVLSSVGCSHQASDGVAESGWRTNAPTRRGRRVEFYSHQRWRTHRGIYHRGCHNVEYFDYNCPFCKALAPDFRTLLATDRGVAVIYKEWPIFGGVSVYAAQAALATQFQGKYLQSHQALLSAPRLAQTGQVDDVLRRSGIDMSKLKNDLLNHRAAIDALLARNQAEALALKLRGTPGILVGRTIAPGITDLKGLQTAVGLARRNQ